MANSKERTLAVLGSGRQGTAAAYDLVKFGDGKSVIMGDLNTEFAQEAASRVNELLNANLVKAERVDVTTQEKLTSFLTEINTVISAVPYYFNLEIAKYR